MARDEVWLCEHLGLMMWTRMRGGKLRFIVASVSDSGRATELYEGDTALEALQALHSDVTSLEFYLSRLRTEPGYRRVVLAGLDPEPDPDVE